MVSMPRGCGRFQIALTGERIGGSVDWVRWLLVKILLEEMVRRLRVPRERR